MADSQKPAVLPEITRKEIKYVPKATTLVKQKKRKGYNETHYYYTNLIFKWTQLKNTFKRANSINKIIRPSTGEP